MARNVKPLFDILARECSFEEKSDFFSQGKSSRILNGKYFNHFIEPWTLQEFSIYFEKNLIGHKIQEPPQMTFEEGREES